VADRNDAGKKPRAISPVSPGAISLDEESSTIYQPPAEKGVAPTSDAIVERPNPPNRSSGRFAAIVRLIVPRRR